MKILFWSDGSGRAQTAIRFGGRIAAACQAEVTILGVAERTDGQEALSRALLQEQDILKGYDLGVDLITRVGNPEREVVKHLVETRYDLVVVGAVCKNPLHRLLDPWWISVQAYRAHTIVETVSTPVLVVFCERPALRRILLCTDPGASLDEAIQFTGKIAGAVNAQVDLFHVMPEPPAMYADLIRLEDDADRVLESNSTLGRTLRRQKDLLEQAGVFGGIRLRHGDVIPELLKELRATEYDLVVSGTPQSESRLRRYVMSDVTREIAHRAELPVLAVRTGRRRLAPVLREFLAGLLRRSPKATEGSAEPPLRE